MHKCTRGYSGGKSAALSAVHLLKWRNFRPAKKCCSGGNTDQGHPCLMSPYRAARTRCHGSNCPT